MACIADQGFACECGAIALASAPSESGKVFVCTRCARGYLGPGVPIPWSRVLRELGNRDSDRFAFEWIRGGVPAELRRTLPELVATAGRFRIADRAGAVLGLVFALVLVLAACKAVLQ